MKYLTKLPAAYYYQPIQSNREGVWLWEDKDTIAVRIMSFVPTPWGKEWLILPSVQKQRADNSEYPYRLVFRLYPPGSSDSATVMQALLEREQVKSVFAWSHYKPLQFFAFHLENKNWLFYSFYERKQDR